MGFSIKKVSSYLKQSIRSSGFFKDFYTLIPGRPGQLNTSSASRSHAAINARRLFVHNYPPVSVARTSFTQLSEGAQCRVTKFAQCLQRIEIRVLLVESPKLQALRHCATAPLRHCATAPLRHCATAPLRHCATAPLRHCAIAPLRHCATAPLRHCATAPLHHCATAPL